MRNLKSAVPAYALEDDEINVLYSAGYIPLPDSLINKIPQNGFAKLLLGVDAPAEFGQLRGDKLYRVTVKESFGVKPKNTEQMLAMESLLNNDIPLTIITGKEGTGKNHITAACVLEMLLERTLAEGKFKRIVLTRTTDEVGKSLGLMPGSVTDKFDVHVNSFKYTFSNLLKGEGKTYIDALYEKGTISYMPIQFMRGVSFPPGTLVWADEIAGLSPFELRMLCTRMGVGCKLVLTGSLEQIDRKSPAHETGLYKLIHSPLIQNSKLVSHIELVENERSPLSSLISEVL